jgi:hypothetical protein
MPSSWEQAIDGGHKMAAVEGRQHVGAGHQAGQLPTANCQLQTANYQLLNYYFLLNY